MSSSFWFIAGVLTGSAATLVSFPWWRTTAGQAPHWRRYAGASLAVAALAGVSVLIYHLLGSPSVVDAAVAARATTSSQTDTAVRSAPSMDAAIAGLEARLARQGGSRSDWLLLAQSYEFLGRSAEAKRARERAAAVTTAGTASTEPSMTASTGLSATAAKPETADDQELAQVVARQQAVRADRNTAVSAQISGTVTIEGRLAARVEPDATLFIYAKSVDSPGPPLAVMRTTVSGWPIAFRLDDTMAMLPTRKLSQFEKVVVEARISRSGQASAAPGDLYATSDVLSPGEAPKLALVINRVKG